MMFKILVVDDEQIVRMGMRSFIDWEENGFELVGEAKDGGTALAMVEHYHPDIIITDLKMPGISGIELIDTLNKNGFLGKILVLSNYDEFELVRNAMRMGASDYLLKVTMERNELLKILKQLSKKLKSERESSEANDKIRYQLIKNKEIAVRNLFLEIFEGMISDEENYKQKAQSFDITLENRTNVLFYIVIDNYEYLKSNGRLKDIKQCALSLINTINNEVLKNRSDFYSIDLNHREFVTILPNATSENIDELARNIKNIIKLYLNISVSIVISGTFTKIAEIKNRLDSCKSALDYKFYLGDGALIHAEQTKLGSDLLCLEKENTAVEIKKYIETDDLPAAICYFDEIIETASEKKIRPELLKNLVMVIINQLYGMLIQWGIKNILELEKYKSALMASETQAQFKERLSTLLNVVSTRLQQLKSGIYRKAINQVIVYINEHIDKKMTLSEIAKEVSMSEGYLCKTFKNETGKQLVKYINYVKMCKAEELLKDPDIMVKEVSNAIGIDDQFYFNKIFKKHVGLSPSEYKKKMSSGSDPDCC